MNLRRICGRSAAGHVGRVSTYRSHIAQPKLAWLLRERSAKIAAGLAGEKRPLAVTLDCISSASYPASKPRRHNPDIVALANASSLAGVDLRLVVMTRAPEEIIYDFTTPRLDLLIDSCVRLVRR